MRAGQRNLLAKRLRRAMTPAEHALWRHLRARQRCNLKFRRQHPVGPFIVDFACLQPALVIEVDGGQHNGSRSDAARDAYLRRCGFHVLRFWNDDVLSNPDGVCRVVDAWIEVRGVRMD
ncbi:MAG: endonuclease domain-containing protein [Luteimonas sp.]